MTTGKQEKAHFIMVILLTLLEPCEKYIITISHIFLFVYIRFTIQYALITYVNVLTESLYIFW